jgi:hypothetical protein
MRHFMQIVENETGPVFYHGTRVELEPGMILAPQSEGYVHGSGFDSLEIKAHRYCEQVLERYRPSNAISRSRAVFMCDTIESIDRAGGYEDFIYEVEPTGPVSRCNLYWYSSLESWCFQLDDPEKAEEYDLKNMARGYWECAPNDIGEPWRDLVEYLSISAKIIRRINA